MGRVQNFLTRIELFLLSESNQINTKPEKFDMLTHVNSVNLPFFSFFLTEIGPKWAKILNKIGQKCEKNLYSFFNLTF